MGRGLGSLDARGVGGLGCAGQRLRSGAFAPDSPVVIFVQACGLPFRFPRAYRRPAHPRPPTPRALEVAISRQLGRIVFVGFSPRIFGGGRSCGARSRPAARAAFWSLRVVVRRRAVCFACGGDVRVLLRDLKPLKMQSDCINEEVQSDCINALHPSYER